MVRREKIKSVENFRYALLERGSLAVLNETLRRKLHLQNWEKRKGIPSPLLTPEQKQKRLDWCIAHQEYDWDNVFFSDESSF